MKADVSVRFTDAIEIRVKECKKRSVTLEYRIGNESWKTQTLRLDDTMRLSLNAEFSQG